MADITSTRAPLEMVRTQIATQNAESEVGVRMLGQSPVTKENVQMGGVDQSDIMDAMEELGAVVAERRKPRLEETKVRKGAGTNAEGMGRITDIEEKLPDQPVDQRLRDLREKLDEFRQSFERGGSGSSRPTKDDILEALRRYDSDPTHQFAALERFRQDVAALGAGDDFLAVIDEARASFREGPMRREVTAGFAAAEIANKMAGSLETDPTAIRNSYRDMVRENQNLGQIFDHLRTFNLASSFDQIIDSFTRIAGRDLDVLNADKDQVTIGETSQLIGNVLSELSKLKQIKTLHSESGLVLDTIKRVHPELKGSNTMPDQNDLTSRLLHFASNPSTSVGDAEKVISGISGNDPGISVTAVNMLRNIHGLMPDAVLPSSVSREQQSRSIMDLSTRLVAREEAYFESHSG
ncbi:HrpJ domain-containing protein [Rhizobium alvei]|uniref:HrpJ domain-containing protein n=1 Tax=Rhizobium alvei TaxID=1132659 RepID=A0ABT8YS42_9HYPH|nr:HrpJ domain-containing protein [Rhizobium alvei]MDO6966449.1 HrpJ domain-containing protein [Rhizobium alvei]